jgi:aromatic-L-amino-acid decarboxylase
VVFRGPGGDPDNRALLDATRRAFCSSTVLDGRLTLRLCVLSHRTHRAHVDETLDVVSGAASRSRTG